MYIQNLILRRRIQVTMNNDDKISTKLFTSEDDEFTADPPPLTAWVSCTTSSDIYLDIPAIAFYIVVEDARIIDHGCTQIYVPSPTCINTVSSAVPLLEIDESIYNHVVDRIRDKLNIDDSKSVIVTGLSRGYFREDE